MPKRRHSRPQSTNPLERGYGPDPLCATNADSLACCRRSWIGQWDELDQPGAIGERPAGVSGYRIARQGGLTTAAIPAMFRREGLSAAARVRGRELVKLSAHPLTIGPAGCPLLLRPDAAQDFAGLVPNLSDGGQVRFCAQDARIAIAPEGLSGAAR